MLLRIHLIHAQNNARRINEVKNTIANFYSRRQTPAPTPAPPTSCSSSQVPLKVSIKTDNYPLETSYTVTNTCSNTVVASVGQGSITAKGAEYSKTYCVPPSTYTFKINDSYGDGKGREKFGSCSLCSQSLFSLTLLPSRNAGCQGICCGYGSGKRTGRMFAACMLFSIFSRLRQSTNQLFPRLVHRLVWF